MNVLQEILALSEQVEETKFYNTISEQFETVFDALYDVVMEQNEITEEDATRAVVCMAADRSEMADAAKTLGLKEAVDKEYQADVELLEGLNDVTIVALNDTLAESFEQAVERVLKSGRKLRMKDKDGNPYKTKRRAAEAAIGASMRAAFGKKGLAKKGLAGKKH